jgi:tripartite-type tricarboxylate transporter receptor subunit TctC
MNAFRFAAAALCLLLPLGAAAQTFPTRAVHLIVPNAPGGAIDILARLYAQHLQPMWGDRPIVVDYKPGANTIVGSEFVAKSPPDGHTILLMVTSHVINPSMRSRLPYDTVKDFAGITLTGVVPILISASTSFAPNNINEVIAAAKKQPNKLSYASPGSGSAMHLSFELLKLESGIDIQHIPFKGSGPAFPEVISGRIQLIVDPLFSSLPHVKAGKLKALAITSAKRVAAAPDIPALGEYIPGFNVESLNGVAVPGATPRDIVRRLNADFLRLLKIPEAQKRMAEFGIIPVGNSPEEFDALIRSDIQKWAKVVKAANIQPD